MGDRIALVDASDESNASLRRHYALRRDIGYVASDTRTYGFMRVADALRFYAAIHERWNAVQVSADLEATGLALQLEVRRMKTAYQRALVLALVAAAEPDVLVVESAEQFDAEPAAALLERVVRRVRHVVVTFAPEAAIPAGLFDTTAAAAGYAPA